MHGQRSTWRIVPLAVFLFAPAALSQTLTVEANNSPVVISSDTTYSQVLVATGGRLEVNATLTVSGDMIVASGGLVTIDSTLTHTLRLNVAGTLNIATNGSIDVTAKGPGPCKTIDAATGAIGTFLCNISAAYGGSHFVQGVPGSVIPTFDEPTNPQFPGSGGSFGTGGGAVLIQAGTVQLDGTIAANGENRLALGASSGAGGTINITTTLLSGNGTLSAKGGPSPTDGFIYYVSAGGLIRTSYASSTFLGTVDVAGGSGGHTGSALFFSNSNRDVIVMAGEYPLRYGESYASVSVKPGATLLLSGLATVSSDIVVATGATVVIQHDRALEAARLAPHISGTLQVDVDITFQVGMTLAGKLILNKKLTLPSLETSLGASITHAPQVTSMHLNVEEAFTLASGSQVVAVGLGLPTQKTIDPLSFAVVSGSMGQNGGSHAGRGGQSHPLLALAETYDDPQNPRFGGGGGGGMSCGSTGGGVGGGLVRITAALAQIDGLIDVDGTSPCLSGGAGGSIVVAARALTGSGYMRARGNPMGASGTTISGGGGGIIHLSYATSTFSDTHLSVAGGVGNLPGGPGVIVQKTVTGAPKIVSSPKTTVKPGFAFNYTPVAVGTPPFAWALTLSPGNVSFDEATGEISWSTEGEATGAFELSVSNAFGSDRQTFTVIATDQAFASDGGFVAPRFISTPDTANVCGTPYRYSGDRFPEVDGTGPFTFSLQSIGSIDLPADLSVDSTTGEFNWMPSKADVGSNPIALRVDGPGGFDLQVFSIEVECVERNNLKLGCGCSDGGGTAFSLLCAWIVRRRRAHKINGS